MSWYTEALKTINHVIQEKGKDKVTKKDIDNAYPFGDRARFPYKMWLKARKEKFQELGFIPSKWETEDKGLFN